MTGTSRMQALHRDLQKVTLTTVSATFACWAYQTWVPVPEPLPASVDLFNWVSDRHRASVARIPWTDLGKHMKMLRVAAR